MSRKEVQRRLTDDEIEDILSFIEPNNKIPVDIAISLMDKIKSQLRSQLRTITTYPCVIPQIKEEIEKQYYDSQVEAGECVGILTAQSIGEKQTQSNLNSFHKAGSSERQPLTSKFCELLNATKEPKAPSCIVYFNHGNGSISEIRNMLGSTLVQLSLKKIATSYEIVFDKQYDQWYTAYDLFENEDYKQYSDCISITIDMDILYKYKLPLKQIATFVTEKYNDMVCVYSPDVFGKIDVYVDTDNIEIPDNLDISIKEAKLLYLDDVVKPLLINIIICGIPGVDDIYFIKEEDEWKVETENTREKLSDSITRYKKILAHADVDMTRTISTNIWDIYNTLGIEAVREFMIEEFSSIMEGINLCHVMLLVDKMTHGGIISSISRYTMRREESGPFGKASFEETLDNFLKAGVYGQEEPTRGVSASIICGKRAKIGTGLCELKVDINSLV